jgi:hypothetical protein
LQCENPSLVVIQFHNADGTSLLRLHQPDVYGDNIAQHRPMVDYVHKTQQSVGGFEEGRKGLAYRILFPVFHQGTYIGAVEFGINNDYITDKIHRFAGYESFFFIDKHLLGTFSRIYAPIQIGESIGIDMPLQYQMFFNEYAQKHGQVENAVFTYSHKSYELNVLQVKNYASKPIVKIVFL